MERVKTHKDLDVWKKAIDFTTEIYMVTKSFPSDEKYGLVSQVRRAAISVSSNIAEGAARNSKKEFVQFLYVALASASELDTQLIISRNLGYIEKTQLEELGAAINDISKMLFGLIRFLKKKPNY